MKLSDLIVGMSFMLSGAIFHLQNYRRQDRPGKIRSMLGKVMLLVGTYLAFGEWIYNLVLSGR